VAFHFWDVPFLLYRNWPWFESNVVEKTAGTEVVPVVWHSIKQLFFICKTHGFLPRQLHFALKIIRHFTFSSVEPKI